VVAETLPGESFGSAALGLTKLFRLPPQDGDSRQAFSVAFDGQVGRARRVGQVSWASPGTPIRPVETVQGQAQVRCKVAAAGKLEACDLIGPVPADPEVARLAVANLDVVAVEPWTDEGRSTVGSMVEIVLSTGPFAKPSIVLDPVIPHNVPAQVIDYRPLTQLQSEVDMGQYYPERAQRMEVQGRTILTCSSVKDEHLSGCRVTEETPPGYGFGIAAMKTSEFLRYSPEAIDGVQVDGPLVMPFTFSLPD